MPSNGHPLITWALEDGKKRLENNNNAARRRKIDWLVEECMAISTKG